MQKGRAALPLTPLQHHELRHTLRLAVFRTKSLPLPVTELEARNALAQVDADLKLGNLIETALPWAEVMAATKRLGRAHTITLGVRGMDLLNVAAAVAIKARVFLTFDARQRALAQAARLQVKP